jgi:hypothetical protein
MKNDMIDFKNLFVVLCMGSLLASCEKEVSQEIVVNTDPNFLGVNCRIGKINYSDSATGAAIGSIAANINLSNQTTNINQFDSLGGFLEFFQSPVYSNDTIYLGAGEYYVVAGTDKLVQKHHGLVDPGNPLSPGFDVLYTYNGTGNLVKKTRTLLSLPAVVESEVNYSYEANGNMVAMTHRNMITGFLVSDATLQFSPITVPKNYLCFFPDETTGAQDIPFFNFGKPPYNALEYVKLRHYSGAGVLTDSLQSTFSNYLLSSDNYVQKVMMRGDVQPWLPVKKGLLSFSYHCN